MTDFADLVDLASARLGGRAVAANDEFFAPRSNLLKPEPPAFIEGKYTARGKWMDGWETRRRREPGHDWCVVRLGVAGVIRGVDIETTHFRGNCPERASIEASDGGRGEWTAILPETPLKGDAHNPFPVGVAGVWTHVRLNILPDGGVARLRVYGEPAPRWSARAKEIDLAAVENGGIAAEASDEFFGSRRHLILPGRARNMGDGWETRRRRGPGHDWCVVRLGARGTIRRIVVDTSHFKGNYPESCALDVRDGEGEWREILPRAKLRPHHVHRFSPAEEFAGTAARLRIYPDGGIARLRLWGAPDGAARLDRMDRGAAAAALKSCGGSSAWAARVADRRPFGGTPGLLRAAEEAWEGLSREDWLEAFRSHARIGERAADRRGRREQAGTKAAPRETLAALAEGNRAYEKKFGHLFLVCATGRGAGEMLEILRARLGNDAEAEWRTATEEQRKITRIRLETL